jgi:hypothetical protein
MSEMWIPVISVVCLFGVLPAVVFNFIYRLKRLKVEERDIEARTEQLHLEIERDRIRLAIIEAEKTRGR